MATQSTAAGQHEDSESSEAGISNASGNGSGPAKKGSAATSSALAHRATGPRTRQGKERSKYNAVKHGVSSNIVLLKGESRLEFNSLLNGLRNDRRPVGALEEVLVGDLAINIWYRRRLLRAEGAEIRKGTEFYWFYKSEREEQEAATFLRSEEKTRAGLIWRLENPFIRKRCIEILQVLKDVIEIRGFDSSVDRHLLVLVFGEAGMTAPSEPLVLSYMIYSHRGVYPDTKELQHLATPEKRKIAFLADLQQQIHNLEAYAEVATRFSGPRKKLESLSRNVPDAPALDRFLRYGASLDRAFDRKLSQLERLQRMRLGQPVAPKIEVRHSLS